MNIKFSQSSFVYFNYSLKYAIQDLGEAGYQGIEIWGGRPHYYRQDLDKEFKSLLKILDKYNLVVPNFIPAQFRYPSYLCSLNEKIRKDSVDYIKTAIRNAVKFRSPSVSICPGMAIEGDPLEKAWKNFKKSLQQLLDFCDKKPVLLLIEPAHRWETNLILTISDCVRMLKEIKSKKLGILLDTGHCHINREDFKRTVKEASSYPLHIHIDDNDGQSDQHNIPGKGSIQFQTLAEALKAINYSGFISAELGFQYTLNPQQAVRETLNGIKKIFQ